MPRRWTLTFVVLAFTAGLAHVVTQQPVTKTTLYLVATAHLDSQWNWTVQDSIREFVPNTFRTNIAYFGRIPSPAARISGSETRTVIAPATHA